jgi:uncharacterized YigZ family protein
VILLFEYKTVKRTCSFETVEKKSRFISHATQVKCEHEAVEFINTMKSKYWDATHNVYAYILKDNATWRYSDDGEPSGTAGIPTLNVIQQEQLFDTCIVTTRYFGGTLLGAGGLVRAYTKAAKSAVDESGILRRIFCFEYNITTDYAMLGKIQSSAAEAGCIAGEVVYAHNVRMQYFIPYSLHNFENLINDITGGTASIIKEKEGKYIDV